MRERLIRFACRLYPAAWLNRYGAEFEALLEDTGGNWRDVLDVLLGALKMQLTTRSFGKIAVSFGVAGALLCGAMSFIAIPNQYTSDAVLRVQLSSRAPQPATDNTGEFVTNLMQNVLARKSLADIIEKQSLYRGELAREPMEGVIDKMRHDVSFERIGDSNAFHVRFRYSNAEQARRTEQQLINKLMAANVVFLRALSRQGSDLTGTNRRFAYDMEVLDPASLPKRPSSPNRFLIAALGLVAGLLFGALTAIVVRTRAAAAPAGNSPKSS
jgi:capsular polysaccharide biosynthesis protein